MARLNMRESHVWHIPSRKTVTQWMSIHNFEAYGCFWGSCVNYQGCRSPRCWGREWSRVSDHGAGVSSAHVAEQDSSCCGDTRHPRMPRIDMNGIGGLSKIFNLAILGVLPSNCLQKWFLVRMDVNWVSPPSPLMACNMRGTCLGNHIIQILLCFTVDTQDTSKLCIQWADRKSYNKHQLTIPSGNLT
jgi:hypothetical protein